MIGNRGNEKVADLVTIDVLDDEPDVLKRIALLNGALFRVLSGSKLIEVRDADYEAGHLEAVIEHRASRPRLSGRVSVEYRSVPRR